MAKKVILRKETIPDAEKVLGKVAVHYNVGGNYQASFSSSDVNNFDVVDKGVVEHRDPERSYLTSTLYPLSFVDSFRSEVKESVSGVLTDNLYATAGVSERAIVGLKDLQVPLFKRALIEIDYYSDYFTVDAFSIHAKFINVTLRNVLITLEASIERFSVKPKNITAYFRSVLIEYKDWETEKIYTRISDIEVIESTLFSSKFKTLLIGDSENVSSSVSDRVATIKDAGVLTWRIPDTLSVNRTTPKMDKQSLVLDEDYEYISSNQSIGISSESGVELFFEDWFKPELSTVSLLTTYNYKNSFGEMAPLEDKTGSFTWTSNTTFTGVDYVLNNSQYIETFGRDFNIPSPSVGQKGVTLEMTCKVEGTDRIYLVSNGSQSFSNGVGESLAIVWFGANSATNKNKFAIISDKDSLVDSNNILLVSNEEYPTGSEVHIAVVAYEGYYRLFIDGELQGVKNVSVPLSFSYGGKTLLGKTPWYNYTVTHKLTIKSFRFTNLALYTSTFIKPNPYKLTVIPNIPSISDVATAYRTGVTCGLRYDQSENSVYAFAAVTDTYGETFTVRSTPIDCSKWNFIQLANTGSELTLFLNGIANSSKQLPYNIKFKDILLGGRDANNFKGSVDNFRIYSKLKDYSLPLRSSELFMKVNNKWNSNLADSNGLLKWNPVLNPTFTTNASAVREAVLASTTEGIYTDNANLLLNKNCFELVVGVALQSYHNSSVVNFTPSQNYTMNVNFTQDKSLFMQFNVASVGAIVTSSELVMEAVEYSAAAFKLKVTVAGLPTILETPFKYGINYTTLFFKLGNIVHLYVDGVSYLAVPYNLQLSFTQLSTGGNSTISSASTYNFSTSQRFLVDNSNGVNGLVVSLYEVFKNTYVIEATYNSLLKSVSTSVLGNGYQDIHIKQDNSELSFYFNNIEAGIFENPYVAGTPRLVILNNYDLSKPVSAGLSYFSAVSSQQDGILAIPYEITAIHDETIYKDIVLNLSSDSLYGEDIVDRSANFKSKDVVNLTTGGYGVTKALKEPGFYFDGKSNLQVDSDDFAFGVEDFYIEFEVNIQNLDERAVILDRYVSGVGSWQISINTDGHLYFTITNSATSPYYYFIDVPTTISLGKWHKLQISRSGAIYKFYLDDKMIYDYSTGSVFDFSRKSVPLSIGRQMTVRNSRYDFTGYLNNIRIVKGSSLDSIYGSTDEIATVPFSDYGMYLDDTFNRDLVDYGIAPAKGSLAVTFTNNGSVLSEGSGYGYKDANSLDCVDTSYLISEPIDLGTEGFKLSFDLMYQQHASSGYSLAILQFGTNLDGVGGFALSIYQGWGGVGTAYLRTSSSSAVTLECNPNSWHRVSISKEEGRLYLYVDGVKSNPLTLGSSFNSEDMLTLGKGYGQYLQNKTVYFDNVRLALGGSTLDSYASETGSEVSTDLSNRVESYTMHNTNASTLMHVHAALGTVKDSKDLTIVQSNIPVVKVLSENFQNCMEFNTNSRLHTTAIDTLFTTTSDFTIETNFAVRAFVPNQTLFRSHNNTTGSTHWVLKIDNDLQGITFSVNTGSNIFKDYSVRFKLEVSTWYKLAVTVVNGSVILHINKDIYRFGDKITSWQAKGSSGSITYFCENFIGLVEVLKISNKALYSKSKSVRNLNRNSHLQLSRGFLVDDGNTPSTWSTNGTFVTSSFKDNLKSLAVGRSSYLESVDVLNPERGAFTVALNISINSLVSDFEVFGITFEDQVSITLSKVSNRVVLRILSENTELNSISLPQDTLLSSYNVIKVSRDFSANVELQVNEHKVIATNVNTNFSKGTLRLTGFEGQIHEVEVFNLDYIDVQSVYNVFNLSFEKGAVTEKYVVSANEGMVFDNRLSTEVKGLSSTSDSVLAFDGLESYLYIPQNHKLLLEQEDFELTFTVYPTSGNNVYQTILSNGFTSFSGEACFIMLYGSSGAPHVPNSASKLAIGTSQGYSYEYNPFLVSNSIIPYNTWTTVRVVREGSLWSLYINGVLEKSATYPGKFNIGLNGTHIGKNIWDGSRSFYAGYLDDFSLSQRGPYSYNEEITLNEGLISGLDFEDVGASYDIVQTAYKADYADSYTSNWSYGRYNDNSAYPYHETIDAINEAIFFPGQSYMYMYNKHFAPGLDPFSISVDFMQTQRSTSYVFCIDTMYSLRIASNNTLYFRVDGVDYSMGTVSLNTWYTFAVSRDSDNTVRFFINGAIKQILYNNKVNIDQGTSFYPMVLGRRWDYRNSVSYLYENFIGYIDNFYFERGYAKYTDNYSVFTDKTVRNTYDSLLSFNSSGPIDTNTNLVWTTRNISYVEGMTEFRSVGARNTTTSGYLQSTSTGVDLGYSDFTIEFYFRPSQIIAEACLLDLSIDPLTQKGIRAIQPPNSASSITVQIGSSTAAEWDLTLNTGINTIENNKTYHLRLTRNLGTIYLYLDGSLKAKSDYVSHISINNMITLFNNISRDKGFNGVIEQFRFKHGQSFSAEASFPKLTGEFR